MLDLCRRIKQNNCPRIACAIAIFFFAALAILPACRPAEKPSSLAGGSVRTLTLFYTSDEEGYLEPRRDRSTTYGGAANMMAALRRHGYRPDGDESLLLSGGDMWTGPAISSWFQGASTVQVANAMGYDAAAIGNHEFDFGLETLRANKAAAHFPFLSANISMAQSGMAPDFCQPYAIREMSGVRIAVIGLTMLKTPGIVTPGYVNGLAFTGYAEALRRAVPRARAEGAELPIVIAHVCPSDLRALIPVASELSIPLLAGGHCHSQLENYEQNGVRIIGPGSHWQSFARVEISFDTSARKVLNTRAELVPVEHPLNANPFTPDPAIETIVAQWSKKVDQALGEVIGYSKTGLKMGWPLFNLLVDAWLWSNPQADIAISNFGGYREAIPPGEIKRTDIIAAWPFQNTIVEVELTGKQVADNLLRCGGAVAGLTYSRSGEHLTTRLKDGRALNPRATYRVLVNSYIYAGGDGCLFQSQNPNGYNTGVPWQEPVIRWILSQKTSPARPLEKFLDSIQRSPLPDRR